MEQSAVVGTVERKITVNADGYLTDDFGLPDVGKPYLAVFDPNDKPQMIRLSPGQYIIKHKNGAITIDSITPSPTLWVAFDSSTSCNSSTSYATMSCTWIWVGTTKICVPPWP